MARPNRTIAPEGELQGENFKSLLSAATGKPFADISSSDVENWATAQGWRQKDVNRIVKGFTKFSKRGGDYALTGPGEFQVGGARGSGRRTGNVKGFDVGDVIGLGRDVSLLAGALETLKPKDKQGFQASPVSTTLESVDALRLPQFVDVRDRTSASGQLGTQEAAQRQYQTQKDLPSTQASVPEGGGDIAFSPNEVIGPLELSGKNPLLDRSGLGLLNINPNDFGGNVKLGQGVSQQRSSAPTNIEGKEVTNLEESKVNDREKLIKMYNKLKGTASSTSQSGKERLAGMKRDFNKMLAKYESTYGEAIDSNYYETTPVLRRILEHFTGQGPEDLKANIRIKPLRFGGKTKFSRNVSL